MLQRLLDHPYISRQLIAYIGNKRRLLGLIERAVDACADDGTANRFVDLFAGSGAVSRFAKLRGFEVVANDWEHYAYILNSAYLRIDKDTLPKLFPNGGIDSVLAELNALPPPSNEERYISKYYAPRNTDTADYRRERMFYTQENARAIDAIRSEIDRRYPNPVDLRRHLLIALLIYEAATHTNTSGVFKAYHKGFGGHGRDALDRILAPIHLEHPVLVDGPSAAVYRRDAADLVRDLDLGPHDIVYLDPPYRQHQYGSNYHLLNTISRWDKPAIDLELDSQGTLRRKAGIRGDWTATRSAYCRRESAINAFRALLDDVRARYVMISYSTDGMIPFESILDACEKHGKVSLMSQDYVVYRGGKQSMARKDRNVEFVLVVDTHNGSKSTDRARLQAQMRLHRLSHLLQVPYRESALESELGLSADGGIAEVGDARIRTIVEAGHRFVNSEQILKQASQLSSADLDELCGKLSRAACTTKAEELGELLRIVEQHPERADGYLRRIPLVLKKLGHKKYRKDFEIWLAAVRALEERAPEAYRAISQEVERLATVVERRLQG
jgi:adenine-specific DNA-methyltransferase